MTPGVALRPASRHAVTRPARARAAADGVATLTMVLAVSAGSLVYAQAVRVTGLVRESAPSEGVAVADARVAVSGAASSATAMTDGDGRFAVDVTPAAGAVLEITKTGYDTARVTLDGDSPTPQLEVSLTPRPGTLQLTRSGTNDCADLPSPPTGVPGLREYARIAVHHDGILTVTSAQLPFFNNPGYVYRRKGDAWEPNESDYVLLRSPIPLLGGFVYAITFGGDKDLCGPWAIDATHPR